MHSLAITKTMKRRNMSFKATVNVTVTNEQELFAFLNAVRQWDGARDEVRTVISVSVESMSASDVKQMLGKLSPPLPFIVEIQAATSESETRH